MLIIRLLRVGKKHQAYFRLVLINKGKRPGKYLESLGFYTPGAKENRVKNLEMERIKYWISKGAQLTPTVHNLLVDAKAIDKPKIKIKIAKPKKAESAKKEETKTGTSGAEKSAKTEAAKQAEAPIVAEAPKKEAIPQPQKAA